jgi:hypothetical protein
MIVVATKEQFQNKVVFTNRLKEIVELILAKLAKYEEIGRVDKAYLIIGYLNKIYMILRYWHYSGLDYSQLDKCIEENLECSLQELKEKLKILPRELWIDISTLISRGDAFPSGINNLEIFGVFKDNVLIDLQSN